MTLSVGTASTATFSTTATPSALTLGAAVAADDIVLLFVSNELNSTTRAVASVSGGGLTWAQLTSLQFNTADATSQHNNMEVWWAHDAAGHSAGSLAITVTMDGAVDDAAMSAMTVTGASTTSPLDGSGAFTNTNTTTSVTTVAVSGVSTTSVDSALFGFFGSSGGGRPSAASGFTEAAGFLNGGGSNFESQEVQYKVETAAQSGITITTTGSQCARWGFIAFGIKAPAAEADITAAASLGFTQASTVTMERDLTASAALGFNEAALFGNITSIAATAALGFSEVATVTREKDFVVAAGLGFAQASPVIIERDFAVSAALGFSAAASVSFGAEDLTVAAAMGASVAASVAVEKHVASTMAFGADMSVVTTVPKKRRAVILAGV